MGKAPLSKNSWKESGKLETATGTKLKREKGERRGFKFQDCKQRERKVCSSAARYLAVLWWEGRIPRSTVGPGGSWATQGKAVPLLEGYLVQTVEITWSQQTPEDRPHSLML